ncbi:MAG: Vitamin K-dependent protein [Myxococcales bacterium]|nr:Vitamin K-dependent protein [Myxococcales bacterium]
MRHVVVSLALAASCGPSGGLTWDRQSIVGGSVDTADPAVVLIIGHGSSADPVITCTGVIASPHVVLTAAHCLDPDIVGPGRTFTVFTGSDVQDPAQGELPANFVHGQETHYDPQFDGRALSHGHDIGLVVTEAALAAAPLPLNRAPMTPDLRGRPVRLVGFGIDNDGHASTIGVRRQVPSTLDGYTDQLLKFADPIHNTCDGDSGGPALMTLQDTEVVIGISSFGDASCRKSGAETRVDVYASTFVDPFIAANDPSMSLPPDAGIKLAMTRANGCDFGGGGIGGGAPFWLLGLLWFVLRARGANASRRLT